MKNFVPLGTGNSRLMKSSIPAGTTWEQALAMLIAGTFPYDTGQLNAAGISQQGDPLNKNTLLKDATAQKYGGDDTMVPDDVLAMLAGSLTVAYTENSYTLQTPTGTDVTGLVAQALGSVKVETGSYTGTGTYGSSNKNKLTFSGIPIFIAIGCDSSDIGAGVIIGVWGGALAGGSTSWMVKPTTYQDNSVSWYDTSDQDQLNIRGNTYFYIAFIPAGGES